MERRNEVMSRSPTEEMGRARGAEGQGSDVVNRSRVEPEAGGAASTTTK